MKKKQEPAVITISVNGSGAAQIAEHIVASLRDAGISYQQWTNGQGVLDIPVNPREIVSLSGNHVVTLEVVDPDTEA